MAEPTLQELDRRLSYLEGWKEAQDKVFLGFRDDLQEVKQSIAVLDQKIDQSVAALRQELRQSTAALDQKLDQSMAALLHEMHMGLGQMRQEIGEKVSDLNLHIIRLDDRISKLEANASIQFRWLVGIQLTVMVTVMGVLVAIAFGLR